MIDLPPSSLTESVSALAHALVSGAQESSLYPQVLKDRDTTRPRAAKDELWLHLVRSVSRHEATSSETE